MRCPFGNRPQEPPSARRQATQMNVVEYAINHPFRPRFTDGREHRDVCTTDYEFCNSKDGLL
jgi:hypothetical protein